jgi:uncharacterized protein YceH (UPF0502 family)
MKDILLTDSEVRVLGCLLEKEMATPDYYPLSLNALNNACNQKSNRNPVVSYGEETVVQAINGLKEQNLVRQSNVSRVAKYEQIFSQGLNLLTRENATICILLLRGPQTIGEIRNRTERLYAFRGLDEVQETISSLEDMGGLIKRLPRRPGRKESRYMHLLSGESEETIAESTSQPETVTVLIRKNEKNKEELQDQIDELRQELQALRLEFKSFKSQFD